MTYRLALVALLAATSLNVAIAQEAPNSQTLDEQMQRVQSGQPAVPGSWNNGQSTPQPSSRDWPASASAPAQSVAPQVPQVPQAAPVQEAVPSAGEMAAPAAPMAAPVEDYSSRPFVAPNGEVFDSRGGDAIPALPLEIRTVGNIRYITGGVGEEEKAQLKMVENDYNMRLLIVGKDGAYISGAMVRIMDNDGRIVLSTGGAGPFLYASMPAGVYAVEVTAPEGGIKTTSVKVPATAFVKPIMRFTE